MLRFSINLDPENNVTRVKSFPEGAGTILIGRDKECTLRLRNTSVSRKHCQVVFTGNGYTIVDLGSTQGTTVNGMVIQPHEATPLEHGDKLLVGELEMTVAILEEPESADQLNDAAHEAVANLLGKFTQGPSSDTTAYIKILNGDDEGVKFLLVSGDSWTLGRHESCNFVVHNPAIGREQVRITLENGVFYLESLDQAITVDVNGSNITGRHRLVHLDRFKMGTCKAIFFDPSQELLSALEYVEQNNEVSQTKAVDSATFKTLPSMNANSTTTAATNTITATETRDTSPEVDVSAVLTDDELDGELNGSTVNDLKEAAAKVQDEVADPNRTPVVMRQDQTVSSAGSGSGRRRRHREGSVSHVAPTGAIIPDPTGDLADEGSASASSTEPVKNPIIKAGPKTPPPAPSEADIPTSVTKSPRLAPQPQDFKEPIDIFNTVIPGIICLLLLVVIVIGLRYLFS